MNQNDHLRLWKTASIRVLDIRYTLMNKGEELRSYRLPASSFLYSVRGKARVILDGKMHELERYHVLHSGRGGCIDINRVGDEFEYYLILYKAKMSLPIRHTLLELMETSNPFQMQYVFAPSYPINLLDKVQKMCQEWNKQGELEHFHVKGLFYQFVYELLRQQQDWEIRHYKPDLVDQAVYYIEENYNYPITLHSVAEKFNYSISYLGKQFKRKTGKSLIDYVIQIRIQKAQSMLLTIDATLQEIAVRVGYEDVSYFVRLFKKYNGTTPSQFKIQYQNKRQVADYPMMRSKYSNDWEWFWCYIDNEFHYHNKKEGDLSMVKVTKPSMLATLCLCFALLLSACSGGAATTNTGATEQSGASQVVATNPISNASETRIFVDDLGSEVEVPANPKRVVVATWHYPGHFLSLGITPIGVFENAKESKFIGDQVKDAELLTQESIEQTLALNPDLIVTDSTNPNIDKLKEIAPTVVFDLTKRTNRLETLIDIGKIVGKVDEANKQVENWEKRLASTKKRFEEFDSSQTVSVIGDYTKELYIYGPNFGRGTEVLYTSLGLKYPKILEDQLSKTDVRYVQLSEELLPDYLGDYVFISGPTEERKTILDDPLYATLPIVKNKRVYYIHEPSFYFSDPISLNGQLDFFERILLDGAKE
ncbi:AraC family transcriptional regulator [Paenibacillus eucommiae]|uniref:Iron complex transport system substrate-binding protein n=1 Tax=Paenibacillus eucommiae TaxID=1355755 RepID=A0ABS4J2R3_9BACL|nr:AraC family transcriptional regulator [Paenibacillus eucommiae]MBP1994134.1 iron complex transport system substrate-binding protein [Paenibacillus eucommiae]